MPQAIIEINGTAASDEDLPINTLVQLSNDDVGDESTYLWEIIDQPPGAADALSSTSIENPTITPQKEHTYLIQLTVDDGLPTEVVDRKLFRVRELKTDAALISIQETTEGVDSAWGIDQNENLQRLNDRIFGGTVIACLANGALNAGDTVTPTGVATIKSGLPGEERLPDVSPIDGTDAAIASKIIGVVVSTPDGTAAVLNNTVCLVRFSGVFDVATFTGTPSAGDPVYVSDAGAPALAPGTYTRTIGTVADATAGAWKPFLYPLDATDHLLVDGSRDLTGNMAVDPGITIDGVDISEIGWAPGSLDGLGLSWTSVSQATIAAGSCRDQDDSYDMNLAASRVADITVSGAGGLDTGVEGDNWYAVFAIEKADGTTAALLSLSATAPTMPSGYLYKRRVGWVKNVAGDLLLFYQYGSGRDRTVIWEPNVQPVIVNGTGYGTWTTVSLVDGVPPTSLRAFIYLAITGNSIGNNLRTRLPTAAGSLETGLTAQWTGGWTELSTVQASVDSAQQLDVDTTSNSDTAWLSVVGYIDNL